jgi:hypothetical protein
VQFEFDPRTSEINKRKHGIDFLEAQALGNQSTSFSAPKILWRRDISSSGQLVASTGPRLSPIAERQFALLVPGNQRRSKSRPIPESNDKKTTAQNLEERFDRGEDVLDYFDVRQARVVDPQSKSSARNKFGYPPKRNAKPPAVVGEKSARYRGKK